MADDSSETGIAVVSLLVRAPADPGRVLLGVRRPVASSMRHPGVLSTFTMRVPWPFFRSLMAAECGGEVQLGAGDLVKFPGMTSARFGVADSFGSPQVFVTEAILSRKLEIGGHLVDGAISGRVEPVGVAREVVADPKGGGDDETTTMLTLLVDIDAGIELIPRSTRSYTALEWVNGYDLERATRLHDPHILVPDANPFEVCLHGMCVRSAALLHSFEDGGSGG